MKYPGGVVHGLWEDGERLGDALDRGVVDGRREILFAARRPYVNPGETEVVEETYVATGMRDGQRVLRTISALTPETETAPDGMDLYGGNLLGERDADESVEDGSYLLLGAIPGDVDVSVTGPDGTSRPVTSVSTTVLTGDTVFYDKAAWDAGWSPIEAAQLTVSTSDGNRVDVRERSWVG